MNKKIAISLLLVGSLFIVFLFIITLGLAPFPWLDLTQSGLIGDTIGGIAAPIVGFIGAVLVYISFIEQFKANKIQRMAFSKEIQISNATKEMDIFLRLYDQLEESFLNLTYLTKTGQNAVNAYIENLQKGQNFRIGTDPAFEKSLTHLTYRCNVLFKRILNINLPETDDELSKQMLIYFYKNRLADLISAIFNYDKDGTKKIYTTVYQLWDALIKDAANRGYDI